jgi:hypothetical protein
MIGNFFCLGFATGRKSCSFGASVSPFHQLIALQRYSTNLHSCRLHKELLPCTVEQLLSVVKLCFHQLSSDTIESLYTAPEIRKDWNLSDPTSAICCGSPADQPEGHHQDARFNTHSQATATSIGMFLHFSHIIGFVGMKLRRQFRFIPLSKLSTANSH